MQRRAEDGYASLTLKVAFFYEEYGMVASTEPGWIQLAFDMLTGLFERVGLRTNIRKTVGMVCKTFQAAGVQANKAYTQ